MIGWGREISGDLPAAERREWLCTNGIGGFASGTVAGSLTRRYHGLLVAALEPPLGRTLLVAKVDDTVTYDRAGASLATNRWAGGAIDPQGYRAIERFVLDGSTPVWTYAVADALVEKRVWMEPGANTTYVRYRVLRARGLLALQLRILVDYRDYHATTRGDEWRMDIAPVARGLRVIAFEGARPLLLLADRGEARIAHTWYQRFELPRERERGLDAVEDHLHAGTFEASLKPGATLTLVLSAETAPSLDGEQAWRRRARHEAEVLAAWRRAQPAAEGAPAWIGQLVLSADQFVARRPLADDPEGMTVIAGYHWFGDWGRDTMIALPGLTLTTGRPEIAARILRTFARFVDRGMLPNVFPDAGQAPEYNTAGVALWYFEAVRQYVAATNDLEPLHELFPVLGEIIDWHVRGTRYKIHVDPEDGLLFAGEPGVQLTWMDAKVGDWVVTPRIGKPIEINALWLNGLVTMTQFARMLKKPAARYASLAKRTRAGFARFWNESTQCCFDVLDGPEGNDASIRPNQIFAVSLPECALTSAQQRAVVETCGRQLLTSHGLRSLTPDDSSYRRRCSA